MKTLIFQNPTNGHIEDCRHAMIWSLFFGPFYLGAKGAWGAAAFWIFFGICSLGITWLILPFFAEGLLRKHYLRLGWSETFKPRKPEPGIRPPGKALR